MSSSSLLQSAGKPSIALKDSVIWVYVLFFFSGAPALLYQIVWQRALFAIYGINIQAVTIIVAAFMLGLGLGSLFGGVISRQPGVPLLRVFGIIELGIGTFGIVSLRIFNSVAETTAGVSTGKAGALAFVLVLVPTLLMGSTLPILVTYLVRVFGSVGRSVGTLYFVNTLGSAAACFAAVAFTMRHLGESGSVTLAAVINWAIGGIILLLSFRSRGLPAAMAANDPLPLLESESPRRQFLSMPVAVFVSGLAGFISLAYEILWYRTYSFVGDGEAQVFPLLLGFYLAGIAFGSFVTLSFFRRRGFSTLGGELRTIAAFVVLANLVGFLVVPASAQMIQHYFYLRSLPLVALAAALLGATLPLISDAAVRADSRAGSGLSYVYLSNIIGSTLGSFLIGYVAMDVWSTRQIAAFVACCGLLLGAAVLVGSRVSLPQLGITLVCLCAASGAVLFSSHPLYDQLYEKLLKRQFFTSDYRFKFVTENKSGVIAVGPDDTVYGGGVYDGVFNTNLVNDKNGILRPYSMSLWHENPQDVLMIGLASGSWAQVVAAHPQLRKMTVVEINPGYLNLIAKYPAVSSLLKNPKVEIAVDDGRRWLVHNKEQKFDVIIMNTTFNWRSNITDLLSVEFLQIAKRHLKPGGVVFYNTTKSGEVQRTGLSVFQYGMMVQNCLAVSDAPIKMDKERWRQILMQYQIDGTPVLHLDRGSDKHRLDVLMSLPVNQPQIWESLQDAEFVRNRTANRTIVTDDNMGIEWAPRSARIQQ